MIVTDLGTIILLVSRFKMMMRTHELQKDDMVIFFFWCLRKVRFRKMQFLKDGVQTVDIKFDVQITNIIQFQTKESHHKGSR